MITIDYLPHARPIEYWKLTSHFLNKIKPKNKKKIKVNILATNDLNWADYLDSDIACQVIIFPYNGNYLAKAKLSSQDENPYSIKLDEDCFMNNHVWDYLIENIQILPKKTHLRIALDIDNANWIYIFVLMLYLVQLY